MLEALISINVVCTIFMTVLFFTRKTEVPKIPEIKIPEIPKEIKLMVEHKHIKNTTSPIEPSKEDKEWLEKQKQEAEKMTEEFEEMHEAVNDIFDHFIGGTSNEPN